MATPADETIPFQELQGPKLAKVLEKLSDNDERLDHRSKWNRIWLLGLSFAVVVLGIKALD